MAENEKPVEDKQKSGLPSFIKSWKQLYMIVIGELALLILLFYLFTKYFE